MDIDVISTNQADKKCFNCEKSGHYANECCQKLNNGPPRQNQQKGKWRQQFKLKGATEMKAHIHAIIKTNYPDAEAPEYKKFLAEMDNRYF